jgi:ATP-dependent DNA helicase RecG
MKLSEQETHEVVDIFGNDTTRVNLIENRDFGRCSLVKAYKNVLERMNVENTIFTKIGFPLREEKELINSIAMREAVVNAIVHNDYANGSYPKFEFFSDRLEITSSGGLSYGLDSEDFFKGHSAPRNKEIMRIFRDLEIVEQLGSGIPRIIAAYGKDCFELSRNFIRVTFPYVTSLQKRSNQSGVQSGVQSDITNKVLEILKEREFSKTEIAIKLGKSGRTRYLNDLMQKLVSEKIVEYTLPNKPNSRLQKYRLTKSGLKISQQNLGSFE